MKLTILLLLATALNVFGGKIYSQNKRLNLVMEDVPIHEFLSAIEGQSEFFFLYSSKMVDVTKKIDINVDNMLITEVLDEALLSSNIKYIIKDRQILLVNNGSSLLSSIQQGITLSGTVTDQDGILLPGVSIVVKGTTKGAITDGSGKYTLDDVPTDAILIFTFIGMTSQEISLKGRTLINVTLKEETIGLDEVLVIGYGTQKKSEITGAISSVTGEILSKATTVGVQEALQGRLAGVVVTPTTGQPGGALDVTIRGVATFGNGDPLFVVDGIPIMSESGSRNYNPLATLNSEDIQSIQILKDASAAAIYGTRAANGVVLITTNRGAAKPNQINFKISRGVSNVIKLLPMMNSAQFIEFSTEAYTNSGRDIPIGFQEPYLSENLSRNTNWLEEAFSPASLQNYWLGSSGGTENANYSFSAGYLNEEGNLPSSGYSRYSININSDFKIGKKLKIGETIGLANSKWTGTREPSSAEMRYLHQQSPTAPIYDPTAEGGFDGPRQIYGPVNRVQALGRLTLHQVDRTENKAIGSVFLEYEFIPGLTNRTNFGGEMMFENTFNFTPTYVMGSRVSTLASLTEGRRDENTYLIENTTSYKKIFNDIHNISVLIGFIQQKSWTKTIGVTVRTFPDNSLRVIDAAAEDRDIYGNQTGWALRSQIGRFNYSYDGKYNLMAIIRRDGSSRFGKNNRFGMFPSVSGSWIITKEPFMNNLKALSNLTLRVSYGQVGSQDISNFAQYAVIESGVDYVFGAGQTRTPGSSYLTMGNSNLKWEITKQTNIGLDVDFFKGKLSSQLDYYLKNTDGVLVQLPIVSTSGIRRNNGPFVNAGSIQNKGVELIVDYHGRLSGDFDYSISANIATNKNKVIYLEQGLPIIAQLFTGKNSAYTITKVGEEIGSFYGYVMEGIFRDEEDLTNHATQDGSAPGDVKFKDVSGDGVINSQDQTIIGSPNPDFTYGIITNLEFKNFDFSIFLNGKQGHEIYNLVWADLNEAEGDNNQTTELLDRWTPDNRETNIPRAITGNPGQNSRSSTRFLENGSFLRIQNIQLGYNLAPSLKQRLKMSNFRIALTVQNLYTFTKYKGYNPEIGKVNEGARSSLTRGVDFAMVPIPRRIEASIQVGF